MGSAVYGDRPPSGHWWERLRGELGWLLEVVVTEAPRFMDNGAPLRLAAHISDVMRLDILIREV